MAFYTDGLIEAGRAGADQRIEQLARTLNAQSSLDCGALADAILAPESNPEVDDAAVLIVRWTGSGRGGSTAPV
jgi:hypothetical protein